jgi:quercetin dioxygenase-like cupin family protein
MSPEGEGPKVAVLFGDPKAGPVAFQIELAPKSEAGMHKHTSDYHALVLEGPVGHWVDGGEEADKQLVAGTYWFQPGGQFHNDACRGDEPCRAFVFMPEAMDMMPQASE